VIPRAAIPALARVLGAVLLGVLKAGDLAARAFGHGPTPPVYSEHRCPKCWCQYGHEEWCR
jgi:hypothetical protein